VKHIERNDRFFIALIKLKRQKVETERNIGVRCRSWFCGANLWPPM